MTDTASENVGISCARLGGEDVLGAAGNPAVGTSMLPPDRHLKLTKSLNREVRRMKRGLLLVRARLQIEYFFLKINLRATKAVRDLYGSLREFIAKFGHINLPKGN
jgi:hypothetical protein